MKQFFYDLGKFIFAIVIVQIVWILIGLLLFSNP